MNSNDLSPPLSDILESYCNVNAVSIRDLANDLRTSIKPEIADKFRQQLSDAIKYHTITSEQYEAITGEDFDTQEDLFVWLQELWNDLFER